MTRNVTIENNVFDETGGGHYAIQANAYENLHIRNNSALQSLKIFADVGPGTNVRVVGNVAPMAPWECESTIVYRFNVWSATKCGATDLRASTGFRDPGRLDLRLVPGAAGVDRGDPESYPRTDITGLRRPRGKAPDAGAYEMG